MLGLFQQRFLALNRLNVLIVVQIGKINLQRKSGKILFMRFSHFYGKKSKPKNVLIASLSFKKMEDATI